MEKKLIRCDRCQELDNHDDDPECCVYLCRKWVALRNNDGKKLTIKQEVLEIHKKFKFLKSFTEEDKTSFSSMMLAFELFRKYLQLEADFYPEILVDLKKIFVNEINKIESE